jgi:hypothetical protein
LELSIHIPITKKEITLTQSHPNIIVAVVGNRLAVEKLQANTSERRITREDNVRTSALNYLSNWSLQIEPKQKCFLTWQTMDP